MHCLHLCLHCLEAYNKQQEAEEKAIQAKRAKEWDKANQRHQTITQIFTKATENPITETDTQTIDRIWREIDQGNRDGLPLITYDEKTLLKIVEKKQKTWPQLSETVRLSVLPRIKNLDERWTIFLTLPQETRDSPKGMRQLVGDPIESLPYLSGIGQVTKRVALAAFQCPEVTREQRGVMWDRYVPPSLKDDDELLWASVRRASIASCCCFIEAPTIWGKSHIDRIKAGETSGNRWVCEVSCIQRVVCCPCHTADDYLTIHQRKEERSRLPAAEPML